MEQQVCAAAWDGNVDEVRRLIEKDEFSSQVMMTELISCISVEQPTSCVDYFTPLLLACRNGRVPVVQYLVEERKVKVERTTKPCSQQPLHWACFEGSADIAKILIEKGGANVDIQTGGWTPLHYACLNRGANHVNNLAKYLVEERHANVEARNKNGHTPLHTACQVRNLPMVQYLAQRMQKIDATVLSIAFERRLPGNILRMLLVQYSRSNRLSTNGSDLCDLHSVLKCPPPTGSVPSTFLELFEAKDFSMLDAHGQVGLHMVLDSMCERSDRIPLSMAVLRREPRAATLRNPNTGLFPFQEAASTCSMTTNSSTLDTDVEHDESQWVGAVYELLRNHDPSLARIDLL